MVDLLVFQIWTRIDDTGRRRAGREKIMRNKFMMLRGEGRGVLKKRIYLESYPGVGGEGAQPMDVQTLMLSFCKI